MLLFKALNTDSQEPWGSRAEEEKNAQADDVVEPVAKKAKQEFDIEQQFRNSLISLSDGSEGEEKATHALEEILNSHHLTGKSIAPKYVNLKFACLKNLMKLYEKAGRLQDAIELGIQATNLDADDVSLVYQVGRMAVQSNDFDLALQCFRNGLQLRPRHWPCLDSLVRLTFAMARFGECCALCSEALKADRRYRPALYCLHEMVAMQASLANYLDSETKELLEDAALREIVFKDHQFCQGIKEFAENVRSKLQEKAAAIQSKPVPLVTFNRPLSDPKWSTLLGAVYEKYNSLVRENSLHLSVDMRSLLSSKELDKPKSEPETMDVDNPIETSVAEAIPSGSADDGRDMSAENSEFKISPSVALTKMVRNCNIDETLVEKRRSSRACVVHAWGANETESRSQRENSDSNDESPVSMLSSILFEEIREWAEEERTETVKKEASCETESDTVTREEDEVISVDEGCNEEVIEMLRTLTPHTLMHHSRDLLLRLAPRFDRRWPRTMLRQYASLFESVFGIHFQHSIDVPEERRLDYIQAYLLALELQADRVQSELESENRDLARGEELYPRFPHTLMVHQWMLKEKQDTTAYRQCYIRLRWLDYLWQFCLKDQMMAEHSLEEVGSCLEDEIGPHEVRRANCTQAPLLNRSAVDVHLAGLNRCVGVVRLRALAAEERYDKLLEAWKEDQQSGGREIEPRSLTPVHCETRLMVHRALFFTDRWMEGFTHGLVSTDIARRWLQDPDRQDSAEEHTETTLRRFAWRSLLITALCWKALPIADRPDCSRGDAARLVLAGVLIVQDSFWHAGLPVQEEVWLLLFDILQLLEDKEPQLRRSTTKNRVEEIDLPPSLTCLFVGHEYFASLRRCVKNRGRFLRHILYTIGKWPRGVKGYYGDADDVEALFTQALFCLHGVTKRGKIRVLDDHHTNKLPLRDYKTMQLVYQHFRPDVIPEFDSIRSLSVTADVVQVLKMIVKRLGRFEDKFGLTDESFERLLSSDSTFLRQFRSEWEEEETEQRPVSKEIYYLLADYHFKNHALEEAVDFYRKDLRFNPLRFDSWAALSLARLSLIQKGLDQKDVSLMERLIDEVDVCMNGFDCALNLNNKCSKLMVENGTLCYEIFSYADKYYRQWTLHGSCPSKPLLHACCRWRREMLIVAEQRFTEAIACGQEDEHELWYYCYMRGKCAEKAGRCLWTEVMPHYRKALLMLHNAGAKYPRRVFFYGTIPTLSLETIEVFYRCHAALVKWLLSCADRDDVDEDLDRAEAELVALSNSDFAQMERVKSAQKRGRQKPSAPPVISVAVQRRSKRRTETEESCPTSEAEAEEGGGSGVDSREASIVVAEAIEAILDAVDREVVVRDCVNNLLEETEAAVGPDPPSLEELRVRQWHRCVSLCLAAFELLTQRLPHHYKSVRQVARICLQRPPFRDIDKAVAYLWTGGGADCGKFPVCALFKDRKSNNLFNGIYRNPIHDLDRCGNFSHHMRCCVDLLLRALRQHNDWVALKEVCLSLLHSIPEVKNVCVTATELSLLQRRAFGLCLQSVDQLLTEPASSRVPMDAEAWLGSLHQMHSSAELRRMSVYKLWRLYRQASRSYPVFRNDAFRCLVRAFFMSGCEVKSNVPVIQQIREYLQIST